MLTAKFIYNFFRFTGPDEYRRTEFVRDYRIADGIRSLVDHKEEVIRLATEKVISWAASKGITLNVKPPYPSQKYPGKMWIEFRFTGLTL
jgi:hypothetical protein